MHGGVMTRGVAEVPGNEKRDPHNRVAFFFCAGADARTVQHQLNIGRVETLATFCASRDGTGGVMASLGEASLGAEEASRTGAHTASVACRFQCVSGNV